MNFFPWHIGDYAAHTRNLSLMEDLAYRRLLDAYYLAEQPLSGSATSVAREIGMRDQATEVEYILGRFFEHEGDIWRNKRADQEIAKYLGKKDQASKAGKASAERRLNAGSTVVGEKSTEVGKDGNGRSTNQEPRTKNQKDTPKPPSGADLLFADFWKAYPRKVGKDAARKAFDKRKPDADLLEQMLQAIRRQLESPAWIKDGGQFIPHPSTWLNEGRWQDELELAGPIAGDDWTRSAA